MQTPRSTNEPPGPSPSPLNDFLNGEPAILAELALECFELANKTEDPREKARLLDLAAKHSEDNARALWEMSPEYAAALDVIALNHRAEAAHLRAEADHGADSIEAELADHRVAVELFLTHIAGISRPVMPHLTPDDIHPPNDIHRDRAQALLEIPPLPNPVAAERYVRNPVLNNLVYYAQTATLGRLHAAPMNGFLRRFLPEQLASILERMGLIQTGIDRDDDTSDEPVDLSSQVEVDSLLLLRDPKRLFEEFDRRMKYPYASLDPDIIRPLFERAVEATQTYIDHLESGRPTCDIAEQFMLDFLLELATAERDLYQAVVTCGDIHNPDVAVAQFQYLNLESTPIEFLLRLSSQWATAFESEQPYDELATLRHDLETQLEAARPAASIVASIVASIATAA